MSAEAGTTEVLEEHQHERSSRQEPVRLPSLREYNEKQREVMIDANSFWLTGIALARPPTRSDCVKRYFETKADERFRQLYTYDCEAV